LSRVRDSDEGACEAGSSPCFMHELGADGTSVVDPQQERDVVRWRKVYWPIRSEPDLRAWMQARCERGTRIALPVAVAHGQPLTFREWQPGARLAHGLWRIPYPAEGQEVTPTVVLAPVVGFDRQGYRLGYGGGFFDRTLAVLRPKPLVLGLGYPCTAIATIFPQPHDIPMDRIVTGTTSGVLPGRN